MIPKNIKLTRWQALLIILVFFILGYIYVGGVSTPIAENVQTIAHRGGDYVPGNTIAAFEKTIASGVVDWLEFDIQMTMDGALVVYHDNMVSQFGEDAGPVGDYTLAEMQSFDLGEGQHVPTFTAAIALAKEHQIDIMPEAKNPSLYPGIEAQMITELASADYIERTIMQSFSAESLDIFHQLAPELALCELYGLTHWQFNLKPPYAGQAENLCVMSEMIFINPLMIRQAHKEGRQVFLYLGIFKTPWVMRFSLILGADGLIVDDFMTLAKILGNTP